MGHNEKQFAAKANAKAMRMWLTLCIILSGAYAVEIIKGLKTVQYFTILELCCWGHFL